MSAACHEINRTRGHKVLAGCIRYEWLGKLLTPCSCPPSKQAGLYIKNLKGRRAPIARSVALKNSCQALQHVRRTNLCELGATVHPLSPETTSPEHGRAKGKLVSAASDYPAQRGTEPEDVLNRGSVNKPTAKDLPRVPDPRVFRWLIVFFFLLPSHWLFANSDKARVLTGIDVLEAEHFSRLAGLRVGLITNHTGLTRDGRTTIDSLQQAPGVQLVKLFSPEHGLLGNVDRKVDSFLDEQTGLMVFSLYGQYRRPTSEMLDGVDALVFDIQDIGARFYTYISTMGYAMEEAAKAGDSLPGAGSAEPHQRSSNGGSSP